MMPVPDQTETTLYPHSDTLNVSPHWNEGAMTPLVSRAIWRVRMGDGDALRFLYARYADDVCGYARTIVSDHDEARDVTRSVFAGLAARLVDRYDEPEIPFPIWLRRVARDVAADTVNQ